MVVKVGGQARCALQLCKADCAAPQYQLLSFRKELVSHQHRQTCIFPLELTMLIDFLMTLANLSVTAVTLPVLWELLHKFLQEYTIRGSS